jgi:hypothetical protein
MAENHTPKETGGTSRPELYTLEEADLLHAAEVLRVLNGLQKDTYIEFPHRLLLRNKTDWLPIGYAVLEDDWYFESITAEERETIGEP